MEYVGDGFTNLGASGLLSRHNLLANLFADFATRYLGEAIEGEFFGGAGTAAGNHLAVDYHAVCQVLLADEVAFAAGETGALAVLQEASLRKYERRRSYGEQPFALGVKLLDGCFDSCTCCKILDAQTPAGEHHCVKLRKVCILQ